MKRKGIGFDSKLYAETKVHKCVVEHVGESWYKGKLLMELFLKEQVFYGNFSKYSLPIP